MKEQRTHHVNTRKRKQSANKKTKKRHCKQNEKGHTGQMKGKTTLKENERKRTHRASDRNECTGQHTNTHTHTHTLRSNKRTKCTKENVYKRTQDK